MKIKSGSNFTLLLTDRGEVYSWGENHNGQLGIGTIDYCYHEPTKINFILDIPIRYISVGNYHAAAIDFDYNVYIWGNNNNGQFGLGYNKNKSTPSIIECLTDKRVEKIYCEGKYTVALTQNGEVYYWGHTQDINIPTKIKFPDDAFIKKLYIGYYDMYAIDTCSKIYYWGDHNNYQLCNENNIYPPLPFIVDMLNNFNVKKIIPLHDSTIILADDKLYYIGLDISEAKEITIMADRVEKVWGNARTVFCKMCNGDFYAWGFNNTGQLGIGNIENQRTPILLNIQLDIKSINYNNGTSYAILTSGEIYTWGKNKLVSEESLLMPTPFTYFIDNDIDIKFINRAKSARKN